MYTVFIYLGNGIIYYIYSIYIFGYGIIYYIVCDMTYNLITYFRISIYWGFCYIHYVLYLVYTVWCIL